MNTIIENPLDLNNLYNNWTARNVVFNRVTNSYQQFNNGNVRFVPMLLCCFLYFVISLFFIEMIGESQFKSFRYCECLMGIRWACGRMA